MAPKPPPKLCGPTGKQALFVMYYLADPNLNATNAALAASYSPKNAAKYSHELMQLPHVKAAINAAMGERFERDAPCCDIRCTTRTASRVAG